MKGLKILLAPNTRIPKWIKMQDLNVEIGLSKIKGKKIRYLIIKGADGEFIPGGVVDIKMPGCSNFYTAFNNLGVLEIYTLNGKKLIARNYHLCLECFSNTGKIYRLEHPKKYFWCRFCQNMWVVDGKIRKD